MKTLITITIVGGTYRNGRPVSGWNDCRLGDGTAVYRPEEGLNQSVVALEREGVDCTAYNARLDDACRKHEPSAAEQSAELYQHQYGYAKPVSLAGWEWSTTFGRWSRLVTFADGWTGWTYPKVG